LSPVFAFPCPEKGAALCTQMNFLSAIIFALQPQELTRKSAVSNVVPLMSIIQAAKTARKPVVLFVEGVRTNGSGILNFPEKVSLPNSLILFYVR
jgi:hypothetical protein